MLTRAAALLLPAGVCIACWRHVPIHHHTQEGPGVVRVCSFCHPTACSRRRRHHRVGHRRCGGRSAPDGFDPRVISSLNFYFTLRHDF